MCWKLLWSGLGLGSCRLQGKLGTKRGRERGREGRREGKKGWEKGWVRVREEGSSKASPRDAAISRRPKRWVCCFIIGFFFWGWLFVSCFLIRGGRGFALHRSSRRQLGSCNMYIQDLWRQWFLGTLRIFLTSFTLPSPPSHAQQLLIVPLFVYELHLLACSWHMLKASEHASDHHYSSNYSAVLFGYYYHYFFKY